MGITIEHPETLETKQTDAAERLCRDFFDDVWARGNADRLSRYLSDDFTYNATPPYAPDRDGYAQMVRDLHRGFPDLQADLEEVVSADGRVAVHWHVEGTHQNEWLGVPASGRRMRLQGMALDTVRDGRIVHEYATQDMLDVLVQLGVIDPDALPG